MKSFFHIAVIVLLTALGTSHASAQTNNGVNLGPLSISMGPNNGAPDALNIAEGTGGRRRP